MSHPLSIYSENWRVRMCNLECAESPEEQGERDALEIAVDLVDKIEDGSLTLGSALREISEAITLCYANIHAGLEISRYQSRKDTLVSFYEMLEHVKRVYKLE